jgi:DNA-binding SARP family transcriptional activator
VTDFGVLGPPFARPLVSLIGDNRRREWCLLTALLVTPGEHTSASTLIDVLWPSDPPRTAREQLMNCLGSIRRSIEQAGLVDVRLVRRGDRHALAIDPHRVDHVVFTSDRNAAAAALRQQDFAYAVTAYLHALAIWRGPALDGYAVGPLAPRAVYFEELRVATTEDYFDACLAAGLGGSAVPDMITHVNLHPMRERGVSQLMRALHSAGRTYEAYRVYQILANRLDVELGISPGPLVRAALEELASASRVADHYVTA